MMFNIRAIRQTPDDKAMTSKERLMLALHSEKPDRMPVTVHQWQQYHLDTYMSGMSDLEANCAVGLDASINYYQEISSFSKDWQVTANPKIHRGQAAIQYTITTPGGVLTTLEGSNVMTTWVIEPMIKKPEDIWLLQKYRPIPKLDQKGVIKAYDELGDHGILRTFLCGKQGGCWQDACELFGMENMIYASYDDPDWVHEFLSILLEQKLHYIEDNLSGMPFDLVETGGGASSNTVISPDIHREFCLPYDKAIHQALHDINHMVVYHTCGGMMKILDAIVENGCDASETLSPMALGGDIETDLDAEMVKSKFHPHVAMIGGMDQVNILGKGAIEIKHEVERLFKVFGVSGGYICSTSDHFFDVPRASLELFAKFAGECKY